MVFLSCLHKSCIIFLKAIPHFVLQIGNQWLDLYHASSASPFIPSQAENKFAICDLVATGMCDLILEDTLGRGWNFFNPFPQWDFCKLCTPNFILENFQSTSVSCSFHIGNNAKTEPTCIYRATRAQFKKFQHILYKDKINHL